jgi:hypothetical protein
MEFPRSQRSIEDRNRYKASEFRNLIFYNLVGILNRDLDDAFYNHLLVYAVFLRILTRDMITPDDIHDARALIQIFLIDFESLYGVERVTFNLHAHLHLPKQVQNFGPLHKASGFPFENMFQYTGKFRNGTRGLVRQTAYGIEIDRFIHFEVPGEVLKIKNPVLNSFMTNLFTKKQPKTKTFEKIAFSELNMRERDILKQRFFDIESKKIAISQKAIHSQTGINLNKKPMFLSSLFHLFFLVYHTVHYDHSFTNYDCHTIQFTCDSITSYGSIVNFFLIDELYFVLVQCYRLLGKDFIKPIKGELSKYNILKRRIGEFYISATLTTEVKLIRIESILKRCIIINEDGDDVILTPVVELKEHD